MADLKSGPDGAARRTQTAERPEAFTGGGFWIGRHSEDQDLLVFDPSLADASAPIVALYSLSQHRTRSFPRATLLQRIHPVTDELSRARAIQEYGQRATLQAAMEAERAAEQSTRKNRQRDGVLAAHRRYIEDIGLEYQGERETGADHRPGRRTKCHVCGIALDDFVGAVCMICEGVLCSCGVCACGSLKSQR